MPRRPQPKQRAGKIFEFDSSDQWMDFSEQNLGPVVVAKAMLEPQGKWEAAKAALVALQEETNEADDGSLRTFSEYLLTKITVRNLKRLRQAEIALNGSVIFAGPNNFGKTTALQALANRSPFPVKIVQLLGTPIRDHLEDSGAQTSELLARAVDRRVRRTVESLLTRAMRW